MARSEDSRDALIVCDGCGWWCPQSECYVHARLGGLYCSPECAMEAAERATGGYSATAATTD
jgi:hypothetical protein